MQNEFLKLLSEEQNLEVIKRAIIDREDNSDALNALKVVIKRLAEHSFADFDTVAVNLEVARIVLESDILLYRSFVDKESFYKYHIDDKNPSDYDYRFDEQDYSNKEIDNNMITYFITEFCRYDFLMYAFSNEVPRGRKIVSDMLNLLIKAGFDLNTHVHSGIHDDDITQEERAQIFESIKSTYLLVAAFPEKVPEQFKEKEPNEEAPTLKMIEECNEVASLLEENKQSKKFINFVACYSASEKLQNDCIKKILDSGDHRKQNLIRTLKQMNDQYQFPEHQDIGHQDDKKLYQRENLFEILKFHKGNISKEKILNSESSYMVQILIHAVVEEYKTLNESNPIEYPINDFTKKIIESVENRFKKVEKYFNALDLPKGAMQSYIDSREKDRISREKKITQ